LKNGPEATAQPSFAAQRFEQKLTKKGENSKIKTIEQEGTENTVVKENFFKFVRPYHGCADVSDMNSRQRLF